MIGRILPVVKFQFVTVLWLVLCLPSGAQEVVYGAAEMSFINSHGPWPMDFPGDPSNRLSSRSKSIALGKQLFSDVRLSRDQRFSCASCHIAEQDFSDGLVTSNTFGRLTRNTPTLHNVAFQRWFGWGGGSDSLWMQNIRPIVSAIELDGLEAVRVTLAQDTAYAEEFNAYSNKPVSAASDDELLVFVGKTIAAYLSTLVSKPTAFDVFRTALLRGDESGINNYPLSARRGLKIFTGRGNCSVCHFGPLFTNGEFAEIGVSYFTREGVDKGRFAGITHLKQSKYNLEGQYNDAPEHAISHKTRFLRQRHDSFGQFRIPGLRSVAQTAPYMHNGSVPSLEAVIEHYSHINLDRLHSDGETILKPLNLSDRDVEDLKSFLQSLNPL